MFKRDENWLAKLLENNRTTTADKWLTLPKEEGSEIFFRILPINPDTSMVEMKHWGIDKSPIPCMKMFGEKDCPICNMLWNARKEYGVDILKYLPSKVHIISVVEVKFVDGEFKPIPVHKFLRVSGEFMGWYKEKLTNKFKQIILDDVEKGYIVMFKRKDNGRIFRDIISELDLTPYISDIEATFIKITDYIKPPSEENVAKYIEATKEKIKYLVEKKTGVKAELQQEEGFNKAGNDDVIKEIIDNIGLDVPNEYMSCIGRKLEELDKCSTCDFKFACKEIKSLIETV